MFPLGELISKLNSKRISANIFMNIHRDSSTVSTFSHLLQAYLPGINQDDTVKKKKSWSLNSLRTGSVFYLFTFNHENNNRFGRF